jgi:hypothetical protein
MFEYRVGVSGGVVSKPITYLAVEEMELPERLFPGMAGRRFGTYVWYTVYPMPWSFTSDHAHTHNRRTGRCECGSLGCAILGLYAHEDLQDDARQRFAYLEKREAKKLQARAASKRKREAVANAP